MTITVANDGGEEGYSELLDGIRIKTLVYGEKSLMVKFLLEAGADLPDHSHPHEQIGYLVSGRLRMRIDGRVVERRAGDSWCIGGGQIHGAEVVEDAVAVEVFSPLREDYIKFCDNIRD